MTVPEAMSTLRGWQQSVDTLWNSQQAAMAQLAGVVAPADSLTLEQLRAIMPGLSADKAAEYLPHLNQAMAEGGITTPLRKAAFLAQLGHESEDLKYFEELASGADYEGRVKDLGNIYPGDGKRFKGRGPIMITGRTHYRDAGAALGLDLVAHPEQVAEPAVGFRTAAWFWNQHAPGQPPLNELADAGNFSEITHRVNGGYTHAADRNRRYAVAKSVLGA
jgi:putative chitinase